jgi:hypothetical protein
MRRRRGLVLATVILGLVWGSAPPARAFQGPVAGLTTGYGGYQLDMDVRWPEPDQTPPAAGWPVLFLGHGAGGNKTSLATSAGNFADDGYVTLTWTNRAVSTDTIPSIFAADLLAIKAWLLDDFQPQHGVPLNPDLFGITGSSLGGYTSWSAALKTDAFAVIAPQNWGFHFFRHGMVRQGSIERITGGPFASVLPTPYDAAGLQAAVDAVFDSAFSAFPAVTIPVMTQVAFLDARTGATYALEDYLALTGGGPRFVYVGTGGHGTPDTDGSFRSDLRNRWLAHYLKGEDNGIEHEPPVQVALLGTNEHLTYAAWPPPDQDTATLHLRDDGRLLAAPPIGDEPADTLVNDPGSSTWASFAPNFALNAIRNALPATTLAYRSAPLGEEVLLLGQPSVRLQVAGTGSHYQVDVHLYDVADGSDPLLLAYGTATLDATPADVTIPLSLTGRRLAAGHRVELELANRDDQDIDYTDGFTPNGGQMRYIPFFEYSTTDVFHDVARVSSLTLPLIAHDVLPVAGVVCAPAPRAGCRLPALAGKSALVVKDGTPDKKDVLTWHWSKGSATTFADLGDPLGADGWVFCLYDGSGTLALEARAPAGGLCDGKACWKQLGSSQAPKGFKYADRSLASDGLSTVQVVAGDALKAKAVVKGKGEHLGDSGHFPALPLSLPVTAQLQTTDTCFEADYATAQVNDAGQLKAK